MRDVPAELQDMLDSRRLKRARCLWIQEPDGSQLGFTDIDIDLDFNVGFGMVTYSSRRGVLPSDIEQTVGLDADNMEITGPIGDDITRAKVLGGHFTNCRCRVFDVAWDNLDAGYIPVMGGRIYDARLLGKNRFELEMRSPAAKLKQVIGRIAAPYCTFDFGDPATCAVTRTQYPGTIVSLGTGAEQFRFRVSLDSPQADNFFNIGTVDFVTGEHAGKTELEIFDFDADGAVELLAPLGVAPSVGDSVILKQGCSKVKLSDDPAALTCMHWQNAGRFGGLDQMPGTDRYLRFTPAGGSS